MPILIGNFAYRVTDLVRHAMKVDTDFVRLGASAVLALGLVLLAFKARLYALKVQDRVIRLEERMRMMTILPEPLRSRISELSVGQFVALRFAADDELTELMRAAVDKRLPPKEIKRSIRNWRPDFFRV